jgi:DNA-binding transcriptional LysR family regulator
LELDLVSSVGGYHSLVSSLPPGLRRPALDNRILLDKLQVLCVVVETGSTARAAEALSLTASVVNGHIRSLEQRMGVALLSASGGEVTLTEAGERVYAWASETLARARAMMRELQSPSDGQQGAALIGASMSIGSYLLPPLLTLFRLEHPSFDVTLVIGERDTILREVERGELDFCVVLLEDPPEGALTGARIRDEEVVLVTAPAGEPFATEIEIDELAQLQMIGSAIGTLARAVLDRTLAQTSVSRFRPVIELGHPEAIKRAAIAGLGAALVLRFTVEEELERGTLREVVVGGVDLHASVYSVKRREKCLTGLQGELLAMIHGALGDAASDRAAVSNPLTAL